MAIDSNKIATKNNPMNDNEIKHIPQFYHSILQATEEAGFDMPSDIKTCGLLRALAASKPNGNFLELGTGTGLSTCWILDGMDERSKLLSVDCEGKFQKIAERFLGTDSRLTLVRDEGGKWIRENKDRKFDFIFADTWPGKYELLEETLAMLKTGGYYIVDDMCEQPNWPSGHELKAQTLIERLDKIENVASTKLDWATGLIVLAKRKASSPPSCEV